jgi:hypothetical protein
MPREVWYIDVNNVSNKMVLNLNSSAEKDLLLFLLFVLMNKYYFHGYGYKNVFISISWPVTNKVLLIPNNLRLTFIYFLC